MKSIAEIEEIVRELHAESLIPPDPIGECGDSHCGANCYICLTYTGEEE